MPVGLFYACATGLIPLGRPAPANYLHFGCLPTLDCSARAAASSASGQNGQTTMMLKSSAAIAWRPRHRGCDRTCRRPGGTQCAYGDDGGCAAKVRAYRKKRPPLEIDIYAPRRRVGAIHIVRRTSPAPTTRATRRPICMCVRRRAVPSTAASGSIRRVVGCTAATPYPLNLMARVQKAPRRWLLRCVPATARREPQAGVFLSRKRPRARPDVL